MIARAVVLLLLLGACSPPAATPSATPTPAPPSPTPTATATASPSPSPTLTPAPTSLNSARGTITVDQPRGFARVNSPFTASGTASVFEGALAWRVVDLGAKELARGNAQASPGAPARGTFSFSVTVTVSAETRAYLEVFSTSPRDGSIDDLARVPLTLAAR